MKKVISFFSLFFFLLIFFPIHLHSTDVSPTITGVTSSSFSVSWTNLTVSSYVIAVATAANFSGTLVSTGTTVVNQNTTSFFNLFSNTTFYFHVKLSTENDTNYTNPAISTRTIPRAPFNLWFTINTSSLSVVMAGPSNDPGPSLIYSISTGNFSTSNSSTSALETVVGTTLTLTNISANSAFTLTSRITSGDNYASSSTVVTSTATLPSSPGSISFDSVEGTSITISWSNNRNSLTPATSYQVQISSGDSGFANYTTSATFVLSVTSTSLAPLTTYYFRIFTFGVGGTNSAFNTAVSTITKSTAAATTTTSTTGSAGTISGKVTQSNDQTITGVDVKAEPEGTRSAITVTGLTKTDGTYLLERLDSNLTYKVVVSWTVNSIKSSAFRSKISPGTASLDFKLEVSYSLSTVKGQLSLAPAVKEKLRSLQLGSKLFQAPANSPAYIEIFQEGRLIVKQPTDQDGRYLVPNLLPGIYQARAFNGKTYSETQNIRLSGGEFSLSFNFKLLEEAEIYNFPNPLIVPKDGAKTTLHIVSGAEELDLNIALLTLSGELVRNITLSEMKSDGTVYTYEWDLTNKDREAVASGVYLMQVRARNTKTDEKTTVIKKIAIVR